MYPAYWAGLFDGEGCVYIAKQKRNDSKKGAVYQLCVEVRMTSKEPIYLLKEQFGGTVTIQPARPHQNRRETFSWKVRALKARAFLEVIQAFCMVKDVQIKKALEFQDLVTSRNHAGRIGMTDDEFILREEFYQELKYLKTIS